MRKAWDLAAWSDEADLGFISEGNSVYALIGSSSAIDSKRYLWLYLGWVMIEIPVMS